MLTKGDVVNVGPSLPSSSRVVEGSAPQTVRSNDVAPATSDMPLCGPSNAPQPKPSRVSQFKMSLAESSVPPASPGSGLTTPTTVVERSSPKLPSRRGTPIVVPTKTPSVARTPSQTASVKPMQMPSMIVDSPSFPAPGVVPSPSFPGPTGSDALSPSPAFHSVIIDSPSFLSPSSTVVGTPASPTPPGVPSPATPSPSAPLSASVLERKPIVASQVRESDAATSRSAASTPVDRKKVSRFLAERT